MKSIFEQQGGTYTTQDDYRLPDVTLPPEEERPIGVWGQRHRHYLKQQHKVLYYNLLTSGKLNEHLTNIDDRANTLFLRIVKELADKEGVTEQLKAENAMLWTQKMNNICHRAMEIVNSEVIFVR